MQSSPPHVGRRASTAISYILSIVLIPILFFLAVLMPRIVLLYAEISPNFPSPVPHVMWLSIYLAIAVALIADCSLLVLLRRVRSEQVFSAPSVICLQVLSCSCFAETACFTVVGFFFPFSFAVAFAACFIGMALRVVKNVIEEATAIKAENDFTI